ncbi:MAG TPA: Uma2 family endonuclease [Polyangiaceae bacterium]
MSREALRTGVTRDDFLAWEAKQEGRHEFFQGEIFAMAGGSPRHAALSARMARALGAALGRECEVFSGDLQLGFAEAERYVYADATVVCGPLKIQPGTRDVVENPSIVVEVLSQSTEQYDRGLKWDGYRRISSLTDYILVSQSAATIEHYQREPDGSWRYRSVGPGERVRLTGQGEIDVASVFDGVFELAGD